MEFISEEEFSKQPKEVQKVFIDYFKLKVGDVAIYLEKPNELCIITEMLPYDDLGGKGTSVMSTNEIGGNEIDTFIKALTEGQLRKFIEDKTECIITILYTPHNNEGYYIDLNSIKNSEVLGGNKLYFKERFKALGADLLQAYWKVACEIAKEED